MGAFSSFQNAIYVAGEAGMRHVPRCLLAELELTMTLPGASRLSDLTPEPLVRAVI